MIDIASILKIAGYALILPIIIAVPLVVFGKFTDTWLEASIPKKDMLSLYICLSLVFFCLVKIILSFGNKDKQSLFNVFIMISLALHFSAKEIRNQGGFTATTLSGQKSEALRKSILGAWHSKYHWGAIVEIIALIFAIYVQL